jgi:hypothetical protein
MSKLTRNYHRDCLIANCIIAPVVIIVYLLYEWLK